MDTIWVFDPNYRVYKEPEPGHIYSSGGPIYREHWRPYKVVTETTRSWVLSNGQKVAKVDHDGHSHHGIAFSQEDVDGMCWADEHRGKIVRLVGSVGYAELKRIAEIIGYTGEVE